MIVSFIGGLVIVEMTPVWRAWMRLLARVQLGLAVKMPVLVWLMERCWRMAPEPARQLMAGVA